MRAISWSFARQHVRPCSVPLSVAVGLPRPPKRSFLSASSHTISASQVLPYARKDLYAVIADISSYPAFLPFCNSAKVLAWSRPDRLQRRWPARAMLGVGWGSLEEQYVSWVYCIPERTVEALAGEAATRLSPELLRELYHGLEAAPAEARSGDGASSNSLFRSLRSTWSLKDESASSSHPTTRVDLSIEFDFQNPIYAAMAGAAIPRVAQTVMDAFEAQAQTVIKQQSSSR